MQSDMVESVLSAIGYRRQAEIGPGSQNQVLIEPAQSYNYDLWNPKESTRHESKKVISPGTVNKIRPC